MTHRTTNPLRFQDHHRRKVELDFEADFVSSDAGALLLREVDLRFGFLQQFAQCYTDYRDPDRIGHALLDLIKQRIFGICLGYEDLNDHDDLRHDPLLALVCGKEDLTGEHRKQQRDQGKPLAGKSTLNRLELSQVGASLAFASATTIPYDGIAPVEANDTTPSTQTRCSRPESNLRSPQNSEGDSRSSLMPISSL